MNRNEKRKENEKRKKEKRSPQNKSFALLSFRIMEPSSVITNKNNKPPIFSPFYLPKKGKRK